MHNSTEPRPHNTSTEYRTCGKANVEIPVLTAEGKARITRIIDMLCHGEQRFIDEARWQLTRIYDVIEYPTLPMCPFSGYVDVAYDKHSKSWSCPMCSSIHCIEYHD